MKAEQVTVARKKLIELCEEFGLDYVICAGRVEDSKEEDKGTAHLLFIAPHLEKRNADMYIKYNWLMRTTMDVMSFARTMVDNLIDHHKLVTVPAAQLQQQQKMAQIPAPKKVEDKADVQDQANITVPPGAGVVETPVTPVPETVEETDSPEPRISDDKPKTKKKKKS